MTVESFNVGGRDPKMFPATRVIVRDDYGNPLCVVIEYAQGDGSGVVHHVLRPTDPDFDITVEALGTKAAKVLKTIQLPNQI